MLSLSKIVGVLILYFSYIIQIDIKLFIKPSNEKILNEELSIDIIEFNLFINSEKEILVFKIFSPIDLIEEDKRELIFKNCEQIKYEQFNAIANIRVLKTN